MPGIVVVIMRQTGRYKRTRDSPPQQTHFIHLIHSIPHLSTSIQPNQTHPTSPCPRKATRPAPAATRAAQRRRVRNLPLPHTSRKSRTNRQHRQRSRRPRRRRSDGMCDYVCFDRGGCMFALLLQYLLKKRGGVDEDGNGGREKGADREERWCGDGRQLLCCW